MRLLPTLLCLTCALVACRSFYGEEAENLARYQYNAQRYFDDAHNLVGSNLLAKLDQAMDQVDRGLEIEPDDYKLLSLKATILLRQSKAGGGAGDRLLQEAETLFQEVYGTRSPSRHERHLLFNYTMALQAQGIRNLTETQRLREAAARGAPGSGDAAANQARAAEHEAVGRSKLMQARDVLGVLHERGDLPRLVHFHSMQIAAALGDHAGTVAQGKAYLDAARADQQRLKDEIVRTPNVSFERVRRTDLQQLQREELEARTFLANLHYDRGEYEAALQHLDVVLELDPARSSDYYNRGRCLRALGRVEAAKADFRKFLATSDLPAGNPKMTDAVRALEMR